MQGQEFTLHCYGVDPEFVKAVSIDAFGPNFQVPLTAQSLQLPSGVIQQELLPIIDTHSRVRVEGHFTPDQICLIANTAGYSAIQLSLPMREEHDLRFIDSGSPVTVVSRSNTEDTRIAESGFYAADSLREKNGLRMPRINVRKAFQMGPTPPPPPPPAPSLASARSGKNVRVQESLKLLTGKPLLHPGEVRIVVRKYRGQG